MPEIPRPAANFPSFLGTQDAMSPLDQRQSYNTIMDDDSVIPQYYFAPRHSTVPLPSPSGKGLISPAQSEDFPTPKAHLFNMMRSSPQPSPRYNTTTQPEERPESRADSDFDSLYDITDDEEEVPLKCSASVKKIARGSRNRYPSVVIPSPSTWPTIEKLRSALSPAPPTSAQLLAPPNKALSSLARTSVLGTSSTPSLDGSMTSEEMEQLSCPSTPQTSNRNSRTDLDWEAPVQLDNQAFETLRHLSQCSTESHHARQDEPQSTQRPAGEMQEVVRPSLGLSIPRSTAQSSMNTPVSALSIPSPGGFFSSLGSSARHTWSMPKKVEESAPNTSTAENFYQLPWESRRNTIAQQTVSLGGSTLDGFNGGDLPTSRPTILSGEGDEILEVKEINPSKTIFQYNEKYNAELEALATVNLSRTADWLSEQDELQAALREMGDMSSPSLSPSTHSRGSSLDKSPKKSVRFVEEPKKSPVEAESPKKTTTYIQGWKHLRAQSRKADSFIHRQTRAEAMHVQRRCLPQVHQDQLLGKFQLATPVRPSPPRPVSEFYTDDPTVLKERIARAQMERQALDQMMPMKWVLQALKQLNGGKLLSQQASKLVSKTRAPRILDVGGVPTNDWAWEVACDYSYATVTTVYTAGNNHTSNVEGPKNHKHMNVPNLWTFPFPNAHFDVISARTLYELLKTDKPLGRSMDEFDLCLKECFRCLKPGGILDFSLLDADIIHAGRHAQAMGVEFGFNLKTRGYDPAPTKAFLPRLKKAGFNDVQRAWMILPMGKTAANWKDTLPVGAEPTEQERSISPDGEVVVNDAPVFGSTADAAMMTGLIGSWAWERWILKLQMEMGKDEDRLLEGVVPVFEEGADSCSGWRYLTGCARKM